MLGVFVFILWQGDPIEKPEDHLYVNVLCLFEFKQEICVFISLDEHGQEL